jgi:hypothetical protein
MHIEDEITAVLACAFLVAIGDAHFDEAERESLGEHAGIVRRAMMARAAIEQAEATGDLDAARELFDVSTPIINEFEDTFWLGDCPPRLEHVGKARREVTSIDELTELERSVAVAIESPFLQKLALFVAEQVASADGDFSDGELHTYGTMAGAWGLPRQEVHDWYRLYAKPILTGDPVEAETSIAEMIDGIREVLNLGLEGEALANLAASLRPLLANPELSDEDRTALLDFLAELGGDGLQSDIENEEEGPQLPAHFKAIFDRDTNAIGEFLQLGRYDNSTAYQGLNALSYAIIVKNLEAAGILVDEGLDIDSVVGGRSSALVCACGSSFLEGVEFCLEAGADVNNPISGAVRLEDGSMGSLDNVTPLHIAVNTGDVEIVTLLLSAGADPEAEDSLGMTPLDYAVRRDDEDLIGLLN